MTQSGEKRKIPPPMDLVQVFKRPYVTVPDIRVAKYYPGKKCPSMSGYTTVHIHVQGDTLGGDLSPYVLRNEQGHLLENIWQFSKVYPRVTAQHTAMSRFRPNDIVWDHPGEEHCRDGVVTPEYWAWRAKGMANPYAVRYPNGFHGRTECLFSLWPGDDDPTQFDRLDYIAARKKIYCGEYIRLAPRTFHFKKLRAMVARGTPLLIVEVDGPDPTLTHAPYDQISIDTPGLPMTEETIKLLLEDPRKPFGHGYVIAALLLGGEAWLQ